jgi:hypothetical protein
VAGLAGVVGAAGVGIGLWLGELPDLPGPLPLLVWLVGFGWAVELLLWLPFVGRSVGLPGEGVGLPGDGVGLSGEGVGLPGDGVGLTGEGVGFPVCVGGPMRSTQ